jgi:hypothetical protein
MSRRPLSRRSLLVAATLCVFTLSPVASYAESRLALVIGNSAYRSASPLLNPSRDARAVTELFQSAGFDVTSAADLTQDEMHKAIREFALKVASKGKDTVAAVYYAGHGVQVGGENFLIPVDATIRRQAEVPLQGVRFGDLMNLLEAVPTKARIVILDACRNNPFEEMKKTVGRGLAMVNAPVGSVVAYSTSPGTEAEDGEGTNSPFTSAFVEAARRPGVPIEQIFKDVRLSVHNATEGRQTPWEVVSLTSNFTFFSGPAKGDTSPVADSKPSSNESAKPVTGRAPAKDDETSPKATPVSLPTQPPEVTSESDAVRTAYWTKQLRPLGQKRAYELVVREDNVDAYRTYLKLYPKGPVVTRIKTIVERRVEMHAWYTAVTVNSEASYKYFLGLYGDSDLAVSAQGLMERAASRSLLASTDPAALGLPPPCKCNVAPTRKAAPKAAPKSSPRSAPKRRAAERRAPVVVEEIIEPVPMRPPVGVGIGIGIGRGPIGGGYHRPGRYPTGPMRPPSRGFNYR